MCGRDVVFRRHLLPPYRVDARGGDDVADEAETGSGADRLLLPGVADQDQAGTGSSGSGLRRRWICALGICPASSTMMTDLRVERGGSVLDVEEEFRKGPARRRYVACRARGRCARRRRRRGYRDRQRETGRRLDEAWWICPIRRLPR